MTIGNRPTDLSRNPPKALTLYNLGCEIDTNSPANNINDLEVGQAIRVAFKNTKALDASYFYKILDNTISPSPRLRKDIPIWLGSSVVDFCFTPGHGNPSTGTRGTSGYIPRSFTWGSIHYYAEPFTPGSKYEALANANPALNVIVSNATNNRLYHFVFLDACYTAGGIDNSGNAGSPDDIWSRAFNIGLSEDYASCFLGWNGYGITNTLSNLKPSYWQRWRLKFWGRLGSNYTVQQSFDYANTNTPGIIEPLNGRLIYPGGMNNGQSTAQFYGDPVTIMLYQ